MRRETAILICLVAAANICVPAFADELPALRTPALKTPALTVPSLPGKTLPGTVLPGLKDPALEIKILAAPTELEAVKTEYNLVSLKWKDNTTSETSFVIERKTQSEDFKQLAVLGKDTVRYDDKSAGPNATYYYRVKAEENGLSSLYSNEVLVNTPALLSPTLEERGFDLDIKPPGELVLPSLDDTEDVIPEGSKETGTDNAEGTTEETIGETAGGITGEMPGEDITEDVPETTAAVQLKAPEKLEAEIKSENEIVLSWEDKSDNEDGFLLYRASTGDWELVGAAGSDTETYTDNNLQTNTTYYYVLFAYKGDNYSEQSNQVEIKTTETAAQAADVSAPQNLEAKAQSPTEVLLAWNDKTDNEEGFLIYRTATGQWEEAARVSANVCTYTDKAVKSNSRYYYIIYSYAGDTVSKESNTAEAVTPNEAAVPAAVDYTGASSWALEELKKAVEYGLYTDNIMKNYSQNITREEFCELVVKLYEKLKSSETIPILPNPFRDTDNESILKAFGAGIVKGTGADIFSPYNSITRQDICVMLYRVITGAVPNSDLSIAGVPVFADENLIGSWAIREVKYAYKNNIMKGVGANKIGPRENTSREQALILVKRIYDAYAIK